MRDGSQKDSDYAGNISIENSQLHTLLEADKCKKVEDIEAGS